MRRRKKNNDESLDLLLDTICNVFGGIIFIAMLVAILTSSQSEMIHDDSLSAEILLDEESSIDLKIIQNRIEILKSSISSTQNILDDVGGDKANQAAQALRSLHEAKDRAKTRVENLESWLSEFDETLKDKKLQSESERDALEINIDTLEKELEQLIEASKIDARLPIARKTRLQQLIFAIKGGRLCWIPAGSNWDRFEADFPNQVAIQEVVGGLRVDPITAKGSRIPENIEASDVFKVLTEKSHASKDFFDLYVWPDSVASARIFRNALVEHGFAYQLHTVPQNDSILLAATDKALETQ